MSMQYTLYKIIDVDSGETLANTCNTLESAQELLALLELDHPTCNLEIETQVIRIRFP